MDAIIHAQGIRKHYGKKIALDTVNLTIPAGRIVGLIGPNGAGKTTLLKGILGLATVEGSLQVLGLNE
jgi:ABC-2 type transport system ATP-binding protein